MTPLYNSEDYIRQTLESVISQHYVDWEYIVIDDGSTDHSPEIVASFTSLDSRIRLVRQPNSDVCNARNKGALLASSSTEYLLFFDHDDCLLPEMLSTMVSYMDSNPDLSFAYCALQYIDAHGALMTTKARRPYTPERYVPTRCWVRELPDTVPETPFISLWRSLVVPGSALMRKAFYERSGGWDEAFGRPSEDRDLFLRLALIGNVHYVPRKLVSYRWHASQFTHNPVMDTWETRLSERWANLPHLSPEHRRLFEVTRHFRNGRLDAYLWFRWGSEHFRTGHYAEGMKCSIRGARSLTQLVIRTIREELSRWKSR